MLYCTRATCQKPRLEGKWFCKDCYQTELTLKEPNVKNVPFNPMILIDTIEKAFNNCQHPYAKLEPKKSNWCNVCGAVTFDGEKWIKPHWKDILVVGIMKDIESNSGV